MNSPVRVSERDAAVPMRGHRLTHQREDQVTEVLVNFHAAIAVDDMLLWTAIGSRLRVKLGAGAYVAVGSTKETAASLGAFTAGETKEGTIEVTVPAGAGQRVEELPLRLDYGV